MLFDQGLKICRAISVIGNNLRVQISKDDFRNAHISDVTDLIVPYPFSEISLGDYYIGR